MKIAPFALVLLLLSGCAAADLAAPEPPTGSETPSSSEAPVAIETPSATESPSATPTPTPTAVASVITTAGYGDMKLGKPVPASTSLATWVDDYCVTNGLEEKGSQFAGQWVLASSDDGTVIRTANNAKAGPIVGFTFFDPAITTKSGAHVGSTVAELKKLFPGVRVSKRGVSDVYVVSDNVGRVVFEVASNDAIPTYWTAEEVDTVLFVHVIPAGVKAFTIAGGDVGYACAM